ARGSNAERALLYRDRGISWNSAGFLELSLSESSTSPPAVERIARVEACRPHCPASPTTAHAPRISRDRFWCTLQGNQTPQRAGNRCLADLSLVRFGSYRYPP